MKYAADFFKLTYKYDAENILELSLPDSQPIVMGSSNYTISLDAEDIFGRGQAEGFVLKELLKVPTNCKKNNS